MHFNKCDLPSRFLLIRVTPLLRELLFHVYNTASSHWSHRQNIIGNTGVPLSMQVKPGGRGDGHLPVH